MMFLSSLTNFGSDSNPNAWAMDLNLSMPSCSTQSRAKAVLHDTVRACLRVIWSCGQTFGPAFFMVKLVCGGWYELPAWSTLSGFRPLLSAAAETITFMVE